MKTHFRILACSSFVLFATSCVSIKATRHQDGSLTVSQRGMNATQSTYWISGAKPGRITTADDLAVFRKQFIGKPLPAVPLKCAGYIDATEAKRIEIRLVEKQGGGLAQSWVNGRHRLSDANAPKPFYHWLIP